MYWYPDRLLRGVLFWVTVWLVFTWLVVVRAGVDPRYVWGFLSFRGPGATGDYWGMVVVATFAWSVLYMGARGARAPFHAMLVAWNAIYTAIFTRYAIQQGSAATLQGDAWGFEISLQYLGPILFGSFTLMALAWVLRDLRSGRPSEVKLLPNPQMKRLLCLALAVAPVQFVLFRYGEDNGSLHATAVGLTIIQVIATAMAMLPGQPTADSGAALASPTEPAPAMLGGTEPSHSQDGPAQVRRLPWLHDIVRPFGVGLDRRLPSG